MRNCLFANLPRLATGIAMGLMSLILVSCQQDIELEPPPISEVNGDHLGDSQLKRTSIRDGSVGRYSPYSLVGFSLNMPTEWSSGAAWSTGSNGRNLSGWIAGPVLFNYEIGGDFSSTIQAHESDDRIPVKSTVISGRTYHWWGAFADAESSWNESGVILDRIPSKEDENVNPSLKISARHLPKSEIEYLRSILVSAEYEELSKLKPVPDAVVEPGSDWKVTVENSPFPPISISLPPGWVITPDRGIDTLIGTISGDGITLEYEYGRFAADVLTPDDPSIISKSIANHKFWEEQIAGELFLFTQPESSVPAASSVTGVQLTKLPGAAGEGMKLSVSAQNLDREQQDTVVAILRSIRSASFLRDQ